MSLLVILPMWTKFSQNKIVARVMIAEFVIGVAYWVFYIAISSLIVFQQQKGFGDVSKIMFAALVGNAIGSFLSSWTIHFLGLRVSYTLFQVLSGIAGLGLALSENQNPAILIFISFMVGFGSIASVGRQIILTRFVKENERIVINTGLQQLNGFIGLFGPLLASLLVWVFGFRISLILNGIGLSALGLLVFRKVLIDHEDSTFMARSCLDLNTPMDARAIKTSSIGLIVILLITQFVFMFLTVQLDLMLPIFIRDTLKLDQKFFAFVMLFFSMGCIFSAILIHRKYTSLGSISKIGLRLKFLRKFEGHRDIRDRPLELLSVLVPAIILSSGFFLALILALKVPINTVQVFLILIGVFVGGVGNLFGNVILSTLTQKLSVAQSSFEKRQIGKLFGWMRCFGIAGQTVALFMTPWVVPNTLSILEWCAIILTVLLIFGFILTQISREEMFKWKIQ